MKKNAAKEVHSIVKGSFFPKYYFYGHSAQKNGMPSVIHQIVKMQSSSSHQAVTSGSYQAVISHTYVLAP